MKFLKATLMLGLFLCLTLTAGAQGRSPFDNKKAVDRQTETMAKDLNLTPAQKSKVQALNQDRAKRRTEIRAEMKASTPKTADKPTPAAKSKAQDQRKTMQQNYRKQLKTILSPEQFQQWKELRGEDKAKNGK